MHQTRIEGNTEFITNSEDKISKDMPIFYNPIMQLNRDISLVVMSAFFKDSKHEHPSVALPMEASGIRAARILNELVRTNLLIPKKILINDLSQDAINYAKENIELNIKEIPEDILPEIQFSALDASIFLRMQHPLDYIDLDPFGTPNPFLDSAVQKLARGGLIAVTATDTSALAGTYPKATAKKYWSTPTRTWLMHDAGMRILIRKVQLIGAQYDKGLYPVLSMSTDHYYRIFFRCAQSHTDVHTILAQHQYLQVCNSCHEFFTSKESFESCKKCSQITSFAGPLWIGIMHDTKLVDASIEIAKHFDEKKHRAMHKLLLAIKEECKINTVGHYDLHILAGLHKMQPPKRDDVIAILGNYACKSQYDGHFIKTELSSEKIVEAMRKCSETNQL